MPTLMTGRRLLAGVAVALVATLSLTSCGTSTDANQSKDAGIPSVVKVLALTDLTGPFAFVGEGNKPGWDLAIEEINKQGILGDGVKIELDVRDTGGDPSLAATEVTSGLAGGEFAAVAGPSISSEALAIVPIVKKSGRPTVFAQAGVRGLLSGPGLYRVTPPQETVWPAATDHIIKSGAKTASIVRSSTNPTYSELGEKVIPQLLAAGRVNVVSSFDFDGAASDFKSAASRIAQQAPDAVVTTLIGGQIPTFVVQLRQSGYKGPIYSADAIAGGVLTPAGADGANVFYPTSFSAVNRDSAKFVEAYKAKFGRAPIVYAADAYNQLRMIALGIARAGSVGGPAVTKGLDSVAAEGFIGAQGVKLQFDHNDARVPATLVGWNGKEEVSVG